MLPRGGIGCCNRYGQGYGKQGLQGAGGPDLISRVPNTVDGRSHHLALTPAGRDLYEQIVPEALSLEAELETILGSGEAKILEAMLAQLRARVTELG